MLAFASAVAIFALAGLHDVGGLISYSAVRVAHQKVSTAYDESKWTPASAAVGSDHGKKAWTITNDTSGAPLPPVSDDQRFPSACVLPGAMDLDTNSTYHALCPADAASFMSGADCPGFSAASPAIQVRLPVQDAAAAPTAAAAQLYSPALLEDAEVSACDRGFTGDDHPVLLEDADRISTGDDHSSQLSAVHSAVASLAPATETTDEVATDDIALGDIRTGDCFAVGCAAMSNVFCVPPDGTCDPATGLCTTMPDDTPFHDLNVNNATANDACTNGSCKGAEPTGNKGDQWRQAFAHTLGNSQIRLKSMYLEWIDDIKVGGCAASPCNDGHSATGVNGICVAGECMGGSEPPTPPCADAGTFNLVTPTCSPTTLKPHGTNCTSGSVLFGSCQMRVCVGTSGHSSSSDSVQARDSTFDAGAQAFFDMNINKNEEGAFHRIATSSCSMFDCMIELSSAAAQGLWPLESDAKIGGIMGTTSTVATALSAFRGLPKGLTRHKPRTFRPFFAAGLSLVSLRTASAEGRLVLWGCVWVGGGVVSCAAGE